LSKEQEKDEGSEDSAAGENSQWNLRLGEEKRDWLRRIARMTLSEELCM